MLSDSVRKAAGVAADVIGGLGSGVQKGLQTPAV
jgi:hypothetical protein